MRLFILLSCLMVAPAVAKPLHSAPAKILKTTRALVLGTPTGGDVATGFEIHEVLWDPNGVVGKRTQLPIRALELAVGHGSVLFLDAQRTPVYVAQPAMKLPPKDLKHHVLRVRGFYAFNAHLTTPPVATQAGLVRAMKTGRFEEQLRAEVGFVAERAPAYVFEGKLIDGQVTGLTGQLPVSHADVGPWDHHLEITVKGPARTFFQGGFERLEDGVMVAYLVPDRPFVPNGGALRIWRETRSIALPLVLRVGDAKATLTLTGQTKGTLGPGLGVEGTLAGFIRQTENGHRSQSSGLSKGTPPGHGWHIEVATPKGPLWITLPLVPVDNAPHAILNGIISPQAHIYLALRLGARPVRLSGALTGEGTLSTQ